MDLVPRFASSLFVSVRHSVPLGARLSPFAVGGPTTLFDAEERLLKRSGRLLDALELIWTTNGCLRPGVRTVSSTAPGQGKGVGEEPPFPRPVTKGLGQSHIVGGSYVYVAAPIGPGLSEGTNWERRGDKKDLLPEYRLRIRMLPAGSRYIGKRTGKPIKRYASGMRLGLGSALTSGSRNGGSAPDPQLYEVAYANHGFKETDWGRPVPAPRGLSQRNPSRPRRPRACVRAQASLARE